jgi:hypothetical protein
MNAALRQLFSRIGSFKKAIIIFSVSTAALLSIAKFIALPSNRITEILSSIKLLKIFKKDIIFWWIPSHYGVVGNEMADYLAFYFAKPKIKRNIEANV